MADAIGFRVLGPLEMTVGGVVVPVGTPKQRAVLAMLLINRNRTVSVDALISAVWDEDPPAGARPTVHSYVSNLRRLLGGAGIDPRQVLAGKPPGYRLAVSEEQLDLERFASRKLEGLQASAAGEFEKASELFAAALGEWRGPVLQDLDAYCFVEGFASALMEDKLVVETALVEAEIASGRASSILTRLEMLAAEHPYREAIWAQLMTAYYLCGRQADALTTYRRLQATLVDDLGIDPNPEVRSLHERILRQDSVDAASRARIIADETIVALEHAAAAHGRVVAARLRDLAGNTYALSGPSTRIGRSPDNDIVLSDPKISRHHAVLVDTGTGYQITDLSSSNGTFVSSRRVYGVSAVRDGDSIRVGESELVFEVGPAPASNC